MEKLQGYNPVLQEVQQIDWRNCRSRVITPGTAEVQKSETKMEKVAKSNYGRIICEERIFGNKPSPNSVCIRIDLLPTLGVVIKEMF